VFVHRWVCRFHLRLRTYTFIGSRFRSSVGYTWFGLFYYTVALPRHSRLRVTLHLPHTTRYVDTRITFCYPHRTLFVPGVADHYRTPYPPTIWYAHSSYPFTTYRTTRSLCLCAYSGFCNTAHLPTHTACHTHRYLRRTHCPFVCPCSSYTHTRHHTAQLPPFA